MSQTFLTYEQQLNKLIYEKMLSIPDEEYARDTLEKLSYYSLIGGYKEPFKHAASGNYKHGVTFEEIVSLYFFDEELRTLFLKYILHIERHMKSIISYHFCENFHIRETIPNIALHKKLEIRQKNGQYIIGKQDLFSVVIALRYLIGDNEFVHFKCNLSKLITQVLKDCPHLLKEQLLKEMGFPENWSDISRYKNKLYINCQISSVNFLGQDNLQRQSLLDRLCLFISSYVPIVCAFVFLTHILQICLFQSMLISPYPPAFSKVSA